MLITKIVFGLITYAVFIGFHEALGLDIETAGIIATAVGVVVLVFEYLLFKFFYVMFSPFIFALIFLLVAYLLNGIISTTIYSSPSLQIAMLIGFTYLGLILGYYQRKYIERILYRIFVRSVRKRTRLVQPKKLIDTSVIIDGRIVDIIDTNVIDGDIVIPDFVLKELQYLADSQDHNKRQKGRKGLEIVENLQAKRDNEVVIYIDNEPPHHSPFHSSNVNDANVELGVDSRLVDLALKMHATIITVDYNLEKIAKIKSVEVININKLALSMRQIAFPGDVFTIAIIKPGKDNKQGVGYNEDGTMVVIENGKHLIGSTCDVEVTSVLQNEIGKIIFAKVIEVKNQTT